MLVGAEQFAFTHDRAALLSRVHELEQEVSVLNAIIEGLQAELDHGKEDSA